MKKNKMVTIHLIALLFLLVGLAVTTASTVLLISYNQKSNKYKETTAIVVDHKEKSNGLKAIVIEYNIGEKYYRLTSKHFDKKPEAIDSKIKIKYNPKNHNEIIWIDNNHNNKYLLAGIILLAGDGIIWIIAGFAGKKEKVRLAELNKTRAIDIPITNDHKEEFDPNSKPKVEEPVVEEVEELVLEEYDPSVPLFATEEVPDIFKPNTEEVPVVEETAITVEEEPVIEEPIIKEEPVALVEEPTVAEEIIPSIEVPEEIPFVEETEMVILEITETVKTQELELPELNEQEKTQELELPKMIVEEEPVKIKIAEIPYDMDSPREAVLSSVMETTIAIPTLNKEMIDLYAQPSKNPKSININNDMKNDALSKLLDDIDKNG